MSIVSQLPEQPGEEREAMILDAVVRGEYLPLEWVPVTVGSAKKITLLVMNDALKIGDATEWVRANVTHTTAQQIADVLGISLPTTKLADITHKNAIKTCRACTQTPDSQMAYTSRMKKHSDAVSSQAAGATGLLSTVGKDWALTNSLVGKPDTAANYGWHDTGGQYTSPGGIKLWQPLGLAHDRHHVDYSQVFRGVSRTAYVDGVPRDLFSLLQDPELSKELSYEGLLQTLRHPGVPFYQPLLPPPSPEESEKTLGERCVDWCLTQVGVKTSDPKVAQWLQLCVRGYEPKRKPLGISRGNWCAAFQSGALNACLRAGASMPHDYRAGVVEFVQDTSPGKDGTVPFDGRYVPIQETRSGVWTPSKGDLAIWDRSIKGVPESSWHRHVNRVVEYRSDGIFKTVGGNENGEVRVSEHKINHAALLGWVHYPVDGPPMEACDPLLTPDAIVQHVSDTLRGMAEEFFKFVRGARI